MDRDGYRRPMSDRQTGEIPDDSADRIRFEIRNQVAWITIDSPDRGNALTPAMRDRLGGLLRGLNGRFEARAAVITASGDRHFCTGADLGTPPQPVPRPEGAPQRAVGEVRRMMLDGQLALMPSVLDCEVPVIAAVNGTAAGIGVHLALCCDLVVMADHARFVEIFARRGLVPDGLGAWILPRLVGLQKAKELVFFAEDVPADEAQRLGLCNRVVPGADLRDAATEWAERLASGPTRSFMLSKWLLNRSLDLDRRTLEDNEAWAVELISGTEDAGEGVASFLEKRDPVWRGF